jgi:hypothetical protein
MFAVGEESLNSEVQAASLIVWYRNFHVVKTKLKRSVVAQNAELWGVVLAGGHLQSESVTFCN